MGGKARAVGVLLSDMGRCRRIKGLDVEERVRPRTVETHNDSIRPVAERSARASHEGLNGGVVARALSQDIGGAKEGIQADDKGVHTRVVAHAREAHAVRTLRVVAIEAADRAHGGWKVWSTGATNGDVAFTIRQEKEIDGEGDWEGSWLLREGEEGGASTRWHIDARDAPPERERSRGGATVEKADAASRGGGG